jgi:ATP-dependent exoDNAse (exonuclease V) alpha subunit
VLQHDAESAVAGYDPLTLIVGPAGAGKTTMLRAAVATLHSPPHRAVFGFAPTAKAARVLEDETGMVSDTVAKLLYEWSRPDRRPGDWWQLGPHATVVVDEAGMLGTHDLHRAPTRDESEAGHATAQGRCPLVLPPSAGLNWDE